MDNKFEVLWDALRDEVLTLNTTAADEHVPQIERQIKAVKEQVWSNWNSISYQKFPNIIIFCVVEKDAFCLSALPINSGISCMISPQTLMTGTTNDFKKLCKIEFEAYAKEHKKLFPHNSTQYRIEPAICLGQTGNLQGSYWFLNLCTGRRIKPLSPCQHALSTASTRLLMLMTRIPLLDFFTAWVIISNMATPPTTTMKKTPEVSQEWRNMINKCKSQDWHHQTKRKSQYWKNQTKRKLQEWQNQKRNSKLQTWTYQKKKMRKQKFQEWIKTHKIQEWVTPQ